MSDFEETNLLNILLQQNAEQVQSWLRSVWAEQQQVPEKFNWLGLAEGAAFNARELARKSDEYHSSSLAWAELAASVYEFLAKKYPELSEQYLSSLMTLRAYMIIKFGSVIGNPVLDIEKIVNWFFDNLEISYQDALIKATDWREALSTNNAEEIQKKFETDLEEIRRLRVIKNRLGVIKLLSESQEFRPNKELTAWISLWKQLP